MRNCWNDLVFGVRTHLRTPVATAALVLTLAFGIAANAVAFSLISTFFLRPLPVRQPDRLVRIYSSAPGGMQYFTVSYGDYRDIRALPDVFAGAAVAEPVPLTIGVANAYERAWGERVSTDYFPVLGVVPVSGRFFTEDDAQPGAPQVAVISHGFWTSAFGGEAVAGRTLMLDGEPVTIVGVAPRRFHGINLGITPNVWLPVVRDPQLVSARGGGRFFVLARLERGKTVADARAALDLLGRRLERTYSTNRGVRFSVLPEAQGRVHPLVRGGVLGFSVAFAGVAALILLVACSNLGAVLIARAVWRRREIGIRLALGATRARIVRQLLIESAAIAAAGALFGVLLAWLCVTALAAVPLPAARGAPIGFELAIDARVLAFSVLAAAFSTMLFGLAPALIASRGRVMDALRNSAASLRPAHVRDAIIGVQVAVSIALLTIGAVFLRNLQQAGRVDPGFDPRGVVTASVDLSTRGGRGSETGADWRPLVERVASLPNADGVTLADRVPFEVNITVMSVAAQGHEPLPAESWPPINYAIVDAGYFKTLRIPLLEGRDFNASDTAGAAPVAIVNDVLARRFWGRRDVVGRTLVDRRGNTYQVVGVSAPVKHLTLGEEPVPYLYRPLGQSGARSMTVIARTAENPAAFLQDVRTALRGFDEGIAVFNLGTMSDRMRLAWLPATSGAAVAAVMSFVSLVLTAVGLFGAVAFTVGRRTHEIGVRRTLGAQSGDIIRLVLQRVVFSAAAGLASGAVAGLIASRALRGLLLDVDLADPLVLGAAPALLIVVCAVAAIIPASRALRIQPAVALRQE